MDYSRKALYMSNKKSSGGILCCAPSPQQGEASRRPY
jgi:hypothetical protein